MRERDCRPHSGKMTSLIGHSANLRRRRKEQEKRMTAGSSRRRRRRRKREGKMAEKREQESEWASWICLSRSS